MKKVYRMLSIGISLLFTQNIQAHGNTIVPSDSPELSPEGITNVERVNDIGRVTGYLGIIVFYFVVFGIAMMFITRKDKETFRKWRLMTILATFAFFILIVVYLI